MNWKWLNGTLLGGFAVMVVAAIALDRQEDLPDRGAIALGVLAIVFGTSWMVLSVVEFGIRLRKKDDEDDSEDE